MKQCRECGTLSTDDTVFCYVCGTKFPELPEVVKKAQLLDIRKKLILVLRTVIEQKKLIKSEDLRKIQNCGSNEILDKENRENIKEHTEIRLAADEKNYVNICHFDWGPERKTYSLESLPDYPVFNSITDNATVSDERNFVKIGEIKKDTTILSDKVIVEPGKEYLVNIYYHNNAKPSSNGKDKGRSGVAFGVKLLAGFSRRLFPGEKGMVCAELRSNNSQPDVVWDSAIITTTCPVSIRFKTASAKIHNSWKANDMILSTKLFTPEGTYLGLNTLDGMVLAGGEFHGTVTFILDVEFLDK